MDVRTILRLLLDEVPVATFEDELQRARDQVAVPATDDELREAGDLARELRLVLHERRRRERELAALYATAGDLISVRSPQRVLQAIARRARQLLDADTAYLTLIDDGRGDTYMRVTDGMVTPEFGRLRLPLGVGLGGLVAQTAMPYSTSDYLDDERFRHAGTIDDAVVGEGLRAILGVPLMVADRVIGVLFAANRERRPFSPDEVNLLSSLAAHAAIAIENARLFEETERAVEELNATNAVVRAHSAAVERAAEAHERLTNLVLRGGSLDDVAAAVAEVLGGAVTIVDADGRWLAGDAGLAPGPEGEGPPGDVLPPVGRTVRDERHGPDAWATPVGPGPDHLGALVLRGRSTLDDADMRTFERAAQVTALLLLNERALTDAELRVRGELLEDLLTRADRDQAATERRARMLGIDLAAPHVLVVASGSAERRHLRASAARLAEARGGLVGDRHGAVVVLLPATEEEPVEVARKALPSAAGARVTCGVARADTLAALPDAFDEADRCRRTLLALGRDGEAAAAGDLGVFALLLNQLGRAEVERFVEVTIGPVLAYDADRGAELTRTLEAYFDAGGNVTRAAARLHVHVNTVYQRCERIAALLTPRWQEPDEALRVHLAVQLRRLHRTL